MRNTSTGMAAVSSPRRAWPANDAFITLLVPSVLRQLARLSSCANEPAAFSGGGKASNVFRFRRVTGSEGSQVQKGHRFRRFTGSEGSQVHRFTGSQVHRFTGSQVHRFTGSQVHRFTGSQVHGSRFRRVSSRFRRVTSLQSTIARESDGVVRWAPMARPLRIERVGAWYHITGRGSERRPIFRDYRFTGSEGSHLYNLQSTGRARGL
jgi:hypothetical protein